MIGGCKYPLFFYLVFAQGKSRIHTSTLNSTSRKTRIYLGKHRYFTYRTPTHIHHTLISSCVEESELPQHLVVKKLASVPEIEKINQFVLFSDLHLRKENVETCIQVLSQVHQLAYERNAGILFLGDFWDKRGSLPVEPLNAAIEQLQCWQQPLIMIPGNHDQVSYDGMVHSLLPIMVSLKRSTFALLIDQPSIFLDALWIPFIRERNQFTKVISSISPIWDQLQAVFCHTDIQGAQLVQNESNHSSLFHYDGVEPDCFPSHVLVYSGHFHKPQQIPNTNIRYVGSPFQVSAMESGQQKCLLVVDRSHRWSVVETIPISVGPKHYYFNLDTIRHSNHSSFDFLQPHDKIFLQIHSDTPESQIAPLVKELRQKASVFTFIRSNKESCVVENVFPVELRDPTRIMQQYGEVSKLSSHLMDMGKQVIQQVLHDSPAQDDKFWDRRRDSSNRVDLTLEWVQLDGFGSFRNSVVYPLSNRGLVLLTGENGDDIASNSNGSGKSTLFMAVGWCLSAAPNNNNNNNNRSSSSLLSDVIHDDRNEAQVTVYGRWNGKSLQITRQRKRASSSHRLRIWLDGEEWTCQELRATQERLDGWIDTRLLPCCVFFGQHASIYDMFAAHDKEWKEQLGLFTPLDIWEGCRKHIRNRIKTVEEEMLRLRSQIQVTENGVQQMLRRIEMQKEYLSNYYNREDDKKNNENGRLESLSVSDTATRLENHLHQLNHQLDDIQHAIQHNKQTMQQLQLVMSQLQQQIAKYQNQYKFLVECIEKQYLEWQRQYTQWKQQRNERKKEIEKLFSTTLTKQQWKEHLCLLQLRWERCEYEWNEKSSRCTHLEQVVVGKEVLDENGKEYVIWKRWEERYRSYKGRHSRIWNEKMNLQMQWEKASKQNEKWICDTCLQPVEPNYQKKALEKLHQVLQTSIQEEAKMANICQNIQSKMNQAKQRYLQLVYDSLTKVKQEMKEIQMEKEKILEERNVVQQKIMQLEQLSKEYHQLDCDDESWKKQSTILLGRIMEEQTDSKTSNLEQLSIDKDGDELNHLIKETLQQKKKECQQHLDNLMKEYRQLQRKYEEQAPILEQCNNKVSELWKEKTECEARIEYLQKEAAFLNSTNTFLSLLQKEREDMEQHQQQLAIWKEQLNQLEKDKQLLQQLDKVFGPRGIPHFVLKSVLYELQQRVNYYLSIICHGYIQVELRPYTLLKNKQLVEMIDKKILMKNSQGAFVNRSYSQLSGGQRRRLGVALALAFHDIGEQRCGFHCNIMVLDEMFQHLDSEGKKRVANVLEQLGKESIFVVAHETDEAMNHLPRAFHDIVKRQNDVSYVIVDKKSS